MRSMVLVSLVSMCLFGTSARSSASDAAVDAANAREQTFRSFTIEFKYTEVVARGAMSDAQLFKVSNPVPERETTLESVNRITFDDKKVRFENNHPLFHAPKGDVVSKPLRVFFNGEVEKLYYPSGMNADGQVTGIIEDVGRPEAMRENMLIPLMAFFRGNDAVVSPYPLIKFRASGARLPVNGIECAEYTHAQAPESSVIVWLAPVRNYVPGRITKKRQGKLVEQTDVTYRQDAKLGWVPESWTATRYSPAGIVTHSAKGQVTDLQANIRPSASEFDVTFPEGCFVFDQRNTKQYRVKADGSMRELTNSGEEISDTVYQPGTPWYVRNRWLIIASLTVVMALGLSYLRRHNRRKSA